MAESTVATRRGSWPTRRRLAGAEERGAAEVEVAEPVVGGRDAAPSGAAAAGVWARSRRRLTIGLLLTVAGVAFGALAVTTAMPATVDDLGGLAFYGWAFSAFSLANLIGVVLAGDAADRRGPAAPFVAGVALFAGGRLVGGLAPTMPTLIGGRALQGFGGGSSAWSPTLRSSAATRKGASRGCWRSCRRPGSFPVSSARR